jgi:hypothetical protein
MLAADGSRQKREWFTCNGGSVSKDPKEYKKPLFFDIANAATPGSVSWWTFVLAWGVVGEDLDITFVVIVASSGSQSVPIFFYHLPKS